MLSKGLQLVALALLSAQVEAAPYNARTQKLHRTEYGTRPTLVSTVTSARTTTLHPSVVVTHTPSVVVTPAAVTSSTTKKTSITTFMPIVTDSYTSTVVVAETDFITTTATYTTSTTMTTISTIAGSGTSTVPIPDGFVFPTPSPGGLKARDLDTRSGGALLPRAGRHNSPHVTGSARRYPARVVVDVLVEIVVPRTVTVTARGTTTRTTTAPTKHATSTVTVTRTSMLPDASTTIFATTTSTTTSTVSASATVTRTATLTATYVSPPTSTFYPVCATTANQVSQAPDGSTLQLLSGSTEPSDFYTDNAYDCCVACFQTPGCLGSNYGADYGALSCELELTGDATCPANQGGSAGIYAESTDGAVDLTFSNGPCGTNQFQ